MPGAFANPRPWGWILIALGGVIVIECAFEFAWRGIGTPAPFDPPRRLVISGLYRWVRNPMYVGLGGVLLGDGLTFPRLTITMLITMACLWCATTLFILGFEEPALSGEVRRGLHRVLQPGPPVDSAGLAYPSGEAVKAGIAVFLSPLTNSKRETYKRFITPP